jgi:DNA-binding NarL/FixJ family response regulator
MFISVLLMSRNHENIATMRRGLLTSGCKDVLTINGRENLDCMLADGRKFDVAVIHIENDHLEGLDDLSALKHSYPKSECVVVSSSNDADLARECMRRGS